jgi:uncharacterized protein YggE
VTGQAEVSAEPDLARVSLGVDSHKPTMAEARTEVTATVDRVLALCRDLKIDPKQVNATRLQVQPEYRWNEKDRKRVLSSDTPCRDRSRSSSATSRSSARCSSAPSTRGVNEIGDPLLDSSRRKELERQAMTKAVEDARLNAEDARDCRGCSARRRAHPERQRRDAADARLSRENGGDGGRTRAPAPSRRTRRAT